MTGVDDLLQKTSRTFALTIPQLPPPTREEVGIAYLLFRIVDTFEDATRWSPDQRIAGIRDFLPLLEEPDPVQARRFSERCASDPPVDHAGYMELLREIPFVLSCLHALAGAQPRHPARARQAIGRGHDRGRGALGHRSRAPPRFDPRAARLLLRRRRDRR